MSAWDSIYPTQAEWAEMMRFERSPAGQQRQRESGELANRAGENGRSIADQRSYELGERATTAGRTLAEQSTIEWHARGREYRENAAVAVADAREAAAEQSDPRDYHRADDHAGDAAADADNGGAGW